MKISFQYTAIVVLISCFSFSQKKEENIGTEVINVVKPYTPTISDAYKIKEVPSLEEEVATQKETIKYTIFSFPVASTFTPNKGVAAKVDKTPQEKIFDNYASFGAGNYGIINAELYVTQSLKNDDYIGATFKYLSSQGGLKNVDLSNKFYETSLEATYGYKTKPLSWNMSLGYQNQIYNWYGLDNSLAIPIILDKINPKQSYNTVVIGGNLSLGESALKNATISFSRFWDAFSSGENRFVAQPKFEFDVLDEKVTTDFSFDYINGSFKNDYFGNPTAKYGYTNVGLSPSFNITKNDLSVNLGANFVYSVANEGGKNKFFIYPNVTASYKIVGDLMIGFAGAQGGLIQNSYHDFVQNNFFVSPTLAIIPTDKKFDIYAGLRGKLASSVGYSVKASFVNEDYKPFFKNNSYDATNFNLEGYAFSNSFDVVYDTVKTLSLSGELKADFSKNVAFGFDATFNNYSLKNQNEAWNLPTLQINSNIDFKITPKWSTGFKVFFVGERKDQFVNTSLVNPISDITLSSYFDLNANVLYKHTNQLSFYLKGNNLANQNYQRWLNFPVQGIQVLLGANLKFDF